MAILLKHWCLLAYSCSCKLLIWQTLKVVRAQIVKEHFKFIVTLTIFNYLKSEAYCGFIGLAITFV
jgi:hypothetical protein